MSGSTVGCLGHEGHKLSGNSDPNPRQEAERSCRGGLSGMDAASCDGSGPPSVGMALRSVPRSGDGVRAPFAQRRAGWGRLLFGYFLLARQEK